MTRTWRALAVPLLVGAALLVPIPEARDPVCRSPEQAAAQAEDKLPALGLPWGKVRAWERVGDGWTVTWQPSHGAWLVRVWVPDGVGRLRWRLETAPWLPGARLSRPAAEFLAGGPRTVAAAHDLVARRDWVIDDRRVVGALFAGGTLPSEHGGDSRPWEGLVAGCLLTGLVARVLLPGVPARGWRHTVGWAALALIFVLPLATPLGARTFAPGVRPWIAEFALIATAGTSLCGIALTAMRFPGILGRPTGRDLAATLAAGLLAGRLTHLPWLAETAGLEMRLAVWLGLALVVGWLAALAGDGLRTVLGGSSGWRRLALAALGVGAALLAGAWAGPVVAIVTAAAADRGKGPWRATAVMVGFIAGVILTGAAYGPPLRDVAILLLSAVTGALLVVLRERVPGGVEANATTSSS